MITLIVQSFNAEYELRRAVFAVLSFYAHCTVPKEQTKLIVFTDKPGFFRTYFDGLPVKYVTLTAELVKSMRGQIDFLHRMKIAAIEMAYRTAPGNLLYFDSDSFFTADPKPCLERLTPHLSYMHKHEYRFEDMASFPLPAGKPFHSYLELIQNKTFQLSDGEKLKVSPKLSSWNAGVMMLHHSHVHLLPDVYALTEQTYPATGNHACEQYAFSIVLETRTQLETCESVNYHYWYRIKKQIADEFFAKVITEKWSTLSSEQKLTHVRNWAKELVRQFDRHVLSLRDNAIQAFNENRFWKGYVWTAKAIRKQPLGDLRFYRDVLYHLKRQISGK